MECLSPSAWKTVRELIDEIREKREREGKISTLNHFVAFFFPVLAEILRDVSFGGIYVGLLNLKSMVWPNGVGATNRRKNLLHEVAVVETNGS